MARAWPATSPPQAGAPAKIQLKAGVACGWQGPGRQQAHCRKEIKSQNAKMKRNHGPHRQNERKSRPKRRKWKEIKAQEGKMKGNQGPKRQNERKSRPKGQNESHPAPAPGGCFSFGVYIAWWRVHIYFVWLYLGSREYRLFDQTLA